MSDSRNSSPPAAAEPQRYVLSMDLPDRVAVIGDISGQACLLDDLLFGTGLIDERGQWSGGDTVLVLLGDVINRGEGSRAAAERLIALRPQAERCGGDVIWLLGIMR